MSGLPAMTIARGLRDGRLFCAAALASGDVLAGAALAADDTEAADPLVEGVG